MTISLTVFKSVWDTSTKTRIDHCDWSSFVSMLYDCSRMKIESKKKSKLITPAVYRNGFTRCNDGVISWAGWVALDVDSHPYNVDNFETGVREMCDGINFVCYSTASSTHEYPKFRIVFETNEHIAFSEIKDFWWALNTYFENLGDKQCKDASRMYYIPANYSNAYNFIFTGNGKPLHVKELIEKYPNEQKESRRPLSFFDQLPERIQRVVLNNKRNQLIDRMEKTYSWNSYEDCPFVNTELLEEYKRIAFVDNSGRYHHIYRLMVSIASSALTRGYPISIQEIVDLIKQIDQETSNRYKKRRLEKEAQHAIEFAFRNNRTASA